MSEEWKNRIYDFEVNPPGRTWEKIATALNESHLDDQFPAILHGMEVKPPASAWKAIAATLGSSKPLTKYRRLSPVLRYAAAAAAIILITWGGLQFFRSGNKNNNDLPLVKTETPATQPRENYSNPSVQQREEELHNDRALEESKQSFARLDLTRRNRNRLNNDAYFTRPVNVEMETVEASPESTYRDLTYSDLPEGTIFQFHPNNNLANRYIMLMTPEGNIIRMSKKLRDFVCCVSGEELDDDCQSQLHKWRSKIASSPSHPGNFMDILNLVNSLQSLNNH